MPDLGNTSVFSQTDASNNTGTQPSWSGSAAPSTIDDAGRALQGAVFREWNWRSFTVTAGGTANAKTLTYSVAPAALYTGQKFAFIANTANTGTATLNVNSLGAKTIKKDVAGVLTALSSGDMATNQYVEATYNGTDFIWTNWQGASSVSLGANTFTAAQTISIDDAATNTVTDILKLAHSTSGTAVASFGAGLLYQLEDAAGTLTDAASIDAVWVDPTNASEDSAISFKTMIAGSAKAEAARIAQGMTLGSPTGGDKGAGTINATAVYDDNVQILPVISGTLITTTGGTSLDATGIPSWVKRIVIGFRGVSTSGTSDLLVQIGDSGGIETSGYVSTASNQSGGSTASSTAGFIVTTPTVATDAISGHVTLTLIGAATNAWVCSSTLKRSTNTINQSAGDKALSATLDRFRITTVGGTDTFDIVSVNYVAD